LPRRTLHRTFSRPVIALAAAGLWAFAPALPAAASGEPQSVGVLVARLQDSSAAERHTFARLAVEELIVAYGGELARAEAEPPRPGSDLLRWRRSTAGYVGHLEALRARLEQGAPVTVRLGSDGILQLQVDRSLLLLAGPRMDDPHALQRTVLSRYCEHYSCSGEALAHLPPPAASGAAEAVWSFAEGRGAALLTDDGLAFPFADVRARSAKRVLAEGLAQELRDLARRLGATVGTTSHGGRIAAGPGDRLRIHLGGHQPLTLAAPTLRRAPWLWPEALRWAAARAEGRAAQAVLPGLERLLSSDAGLALTAPRAPRS